MSVTQLLYKCHVADVVLAGGSLGGPFRAGRKARETALACTFEEMTKKILVTGGTGYIGSHTVVKLMENGADVVILDNLSNSDASVAERIGQIVGKSPRLVIGDLGDDECLNRLFAEDRFESVFHFAGLKAVGESEREPLKYYENNVIGSLNLLQAMARAGVKKIIFSSSATVYGDPGVRKYTEDLPLSPVNVYGRTKLVVEDMLRDLKRASPDWRIALLRYFNPVGAHPSGKIGERPRGIPNNLMPYIAQVAIGQREKLEVFGSDYDTCDGTGVRDFIHVDDLAEGHIAAANYLERASELLTVNLGTGRPNSVLEVIHAFERASGKKVQYEVVSRRAGDLSEYYADPSLAQSLLGWAAKYSIDKMCEDTWRWQSQTALN